MYTGLLHLHSALRWAVVILLVLAIVKAVASFKKGLSAKQIKLALFALIASHLQLIIGLWLYLGNISPVVKSAMDPNSGMTPRLKTFWAFEHFASMLIGIILFTIGYATGKRAKTDVKRARRLFWFYLIGFIIIMSAIPWPFRETIGLGRGWF